MESNAQAELHSKAKLLFGEVCDLPEAEQLPRLRALTDDAELIGFVTLLLQQTQTDHPRIVQPVLNAMSAIAGDEIKVGDTLGAWKLVSEIGQGGMGTVFRAQRSDGHFDQEAAVKLLHGIPSAKALEYLARERQILATLTHPNIARLYDGGATPHGQPYLVMEYVEGIAIDRYVRDKKLPSRDILKLLIDVCDAISFAHQRLIVHCDIKPSNILVTANERPMLLDFGIARLLDSEAKSEAAPAMPSSATCSASSKQTIARAFTPHYASPEQRNGEALTTATDVYSLGKMLAELIKTAVVDRELNAIIDKATADNSVKRYATASALAADIARYLKKLPLEAIGATPAYRANKFTQRNWPWLAAGAVFVLTMGVAVQRVVAERDRAADAEKSAVAERDRAKTSEAASRQTSEFLVSVFDSSNPNAESGDIPASKLIAAAEVRVESEMRGQPATQADLYTALGRVQSNMGQPNQARKNYRRAIEIERKQNRPLELARMLTLEFQNDVLKLDNANMLPLAREALALRERHAPADSEEVAQSLAFAAYALRATSGDLKEAERLIVRALAIYEKRNANGLGMAEALHIAGQVYGVLGQRETAIAAYRRSIAIKQERLGDGHPEVLQSLQYLAGDLNRVRQFIEAEAIFRRIVAQNEKLHGRQNVNMLRPLVYLGAVLITTGRPGEALQIGQEALQIAEKTVGRDSTYAALALSAIGAAQADLGDLAAAEKNFSASLAIMKKYMRPVDNAIAEQALNLGRTLNRMGKAADAYPHLLAAYEIYRKVLGPAHRLTAVTVSELVRNTVAQDKLTDALSWQEMLMAARSITDKDLVAEIAMANALVATKQGGETEAAARLIEAEQLYRALYGEADVRAWLAMLPRCEWLAVRGKTDAVAAMESRVLARQIQSKVVGHLVAHSMVLVRLRQLVAQLS